MTLGAVSAAEAVAPAPGPGFEELYRREFPALAGYCLRLTGDEQAARDTAQEALTRLFARFRKVEQPRPWLYAVATNLCRDSWARRSRDRDTARRAAFALPAEGVPGPDVAVRDAVDRLPARLRPVVLLHYWADLRVEDVASALGLPAGTVKRRLHEARAVLAQTLGGTP